MSCWRLMPLQPCADDESDAFRSDEARQADSHQLKIDPECVTQ